MRARGGVGQQRERDRLGRGEGRAARSSLVLERLHHRLLGRHAVGVRLAEEGVFSVHPTAPGMSDQPPGSGAGMPVAG